MIKNKKIISGFLALIIFVLPLASYGLEEQQEEPGQVLSMELESQEDNQVNFGDGNDKEDEGLDYFTELGEGVYEVDALAELGQVYKKLGLDTRYLGSKAQKTMANLIYELYESSFGFPKKGDKFKLEGLDVEILEMEQMQITKLKLPIETRYDNYKDGDVSEDRVEDILALIDKQTFPANTSLKEVKGYLRHFIKNMSEYDKVMNAHYYSSQAKDNVYETELYGSGKGCYHYALFLSQTIYKQSEGFIYDGSDNILPIPEEGYKANQLKVFLEENAQAGEHLRIDQTHSLIYIASDDNGFYNLQYYGDYRNPFISFMSFQFLAETLNYHRKNFRVYDYNKEINNIEGEIEDETPAPLPIQRIKGEDRYATAVRVSEENFESSKQLVLAYGRNFPDALAGNVLASYLEAPLLLTQSAGIPRVVLDEIKRLGVEKVYLLGGEKALGKELVGKLEGMGLEVERLGAADRYSTAAQIAKTIDGSFNHAFLVSGQDYPDALAIGSVAASKQEPILLTNSKKLSPATKESLKELGVKEVTIIGGTSALSEVVEDQVKALGIEVSRLAGDDRYKTSLKVAEEFFSKKELAQAALASGRDFPDALVAGYMTAMKSMPLFLVGGERLEDDIMDYLLEARLGLTLVGGPSAISTAIEEALNLGLNR